MHHVCFPAGLYTGMGDHYEHTRCNPVGGEMCGQDLHHNVGQHLQVVWNNTQYSTHLFTEKTIDIISNHDHNQVIPELIEKKILELNNNYSIDAAL